MSEHGGADARAMTDAAASRPRWWVYALVAIGIAALAFAIGRFSTFGATTRAATDPSVPNAADAGFARDMQVHHTQAIELAMEIYRKTDDDGVRSLAYDIATSQAGQRGEMYDWLVQWGLPQSGDPLMSWMTDAAHGHTHGSSTATDAELRAAMGMATDDEIAALTEATGTQADCMFLGLMIRHHQGAIPMADAVIDLGQVARVRTVAESMAAGQRAEIDAMTSFEARLGCTR